MRETYPETAPFELVEDAILVALFTAPTEPLPEPHVHARRHRYSRTTQGYDAHVRKKDQEDLESMRTTSLINEDTRQVRARELAAGASSSILDTRERRTNDGVQIVVGTTEGDPTSNIFLSKN